MSKEITIPLQKPIKAHDETLDKLVLREPTGRDIRKFGYPFAVRGDESVDLKPDVLAHYIAALAKIPPSAVDELSGKDFMTIQTAIMPFFEPATLEA